LGTATRFVVHVIPQKSYVCDSYITYKKSLYAGLPVGGMHASPHPPPRSATGLGWYIVFCPPPLFKFSGSATVWWHNIGHFGGGPVCLIMPLIGLRLLERQVFRFIVFQCIHDCFDAFKVQNFSMRPYEARISGLGNIIFVMHYLDRLLPCDYGQCVFQDFEFGLSIEYRGQHR